MITNSMVKKQVLMCPPIYFEVCYDINPDMKETLEKGIRINHKKAMRQWEGLRDIYIQEGLEPVYIESIKGLPDMVFTANAALVYDERIVMGLFKYVQRQPESKYFYNWFTEHDYEVVLFDETFEGGGDALLWRNKIIGGYGFRSDPRGIEAAADYVTFLGKKNDLVLLKLADPRFYHVDTCFCPMGERALVFPAAFENGSWKKLESFGEIIPIDEKDAMRRVCNGVYLEGKSGPKFIVNDISRKLEKMFEKWGIETIINETSEFQKSGGSNRCLTLFL